MKNKDNGKYVFIFILLLALAWILAMHLWGSESQFEDLSERIQRIEAGIVCENLVSVSGFGNYDDCVFLNRIESNNRSINLLKDHLGLQEAYKTGTPGKWVLIEK